MLGYSRRLRSRIGRQLLSHWLILAIAMGSAVYAVASNEPVSTSGTGEPEALAVEVLEEAPSSLGSEAAGQPGATEKPAVAAAPKANNQAPSQQIASAPAATATEAARTRALSSGTPVPGRPACQPSASAAYCIYTVVEGDTLSSLAVRFGIRSGDLLGWELIAASNRPDIVSVDDFIQPGQKLRIPTAPGIVHTIVLGETVGDLAEMFDVTSSAIIQANRLTNQDLLSIGQVLLIPDPKRLSAPEIPPEAVIIPEAPTPEPEPDFAPGEPRSSSGFIWPITASVRITNYMSARHPLGIDLGLGHASGSPIRAAAGGKVVFAGGDPCCSYGLYVIVDHENGLKTLYAHLSRIEVANGQRVVQGQTLGPSGRTGYSTGVHLHFEVHRSGVRVNPMTYLP